MERFVGLGEAIHLDNEPKILKILNIEVQPCYMSKFGRVIDKSEMLLCLECLCQKDTRSLGYFLATCGLSIDMRDADPCVICICFHLARLLPSLLVAFLMFQVYCFCPQSRDLLAVCRLNLSTGRGREV